MPVRERLVACSLTLLRAERTKLEVLIDELIVAVAGEKLAGVEATPNPS
jgi:hypothetical protein